ncbi:serine/threonine-protein kinase-like protein At3g51990 [Cynara cardunculus var. scolymus]|uniref:Concanavalin A-like lectin/glucanase, subgroup n=1 Tax=Cynara cardunculus var. scolymus TaxID=59895 RepID=A0A118JKW2_CYNCS|nr:serine/threonine-protein kinase-like protein At3g51990 [Cynara cardunculus var. scolymus]KVH78206.1 Concanavalin A-like lectin/glucanase, subgroup [Cynara cardunculus var. scolymus]
MGYLSCNAESAISTCDSYTFSKNKKKHPISNPQNKQFKIRDFCFADLKTATNGFSHTNFLGKGSHGSVYRGVLDDGALIAAVKRTTNHHTIGLGQCTTSIASPAENEIETLSRVRSPRLVNLLGFGSDPIDGRKLIVVEYMPNGSLYDLLHKNETRPPGLARRVKIAVQVAKAVHHLHSSNPPVIHRDIKSSNVLFDGKWNARLGDFGLALRGHVEDVKIQCTPPAGTLGYLDPCYLAPGDLSAKSDVFSFGILLLEILSGRNAIDLKYSPPSVVDWAAPFIRSGEYAEIFDPNIEISSDNSGVRQLAVLAARCVKSTAEKRPGMAEVVQCLITAGKRITSLVLGRRRVRRTPPPSIKYEPLNESTETVKASRASSRRTRKVSGATSVPLKTKSNGPDCLKSRHAARSKSIGSVLDIKAAPLDSGLGRRRGGGQGLGVKGSMVTMNRSKSTGELRGTGLVHKRNGGIVLQMIRNPNVRELESSKLLVKFR